MFLWFVLACTGSGTVDITVETDPAGEVPTSFTATTSLWTESETEWTWWYTLDEVLYDGGGGWVLDSVSLTTSGASCAQRQAQLDAAAVFVDAVQAEVGDDFSTVALADVCGAVTAYMDQLAELDPPDGPGWRLSATPEGGFVSQSTGSWKSSWELWDPEQCVFGEDDTSNGTYKWLDLDGELVAEEGDETVTGSFEGSFEGYQGARGTVSAAFEAVRCTLEGTHQLSL